LPVRIRRLHETGAQRIAEAVFVNAWLFKTKPLIPTLLELKTTLFMQDLF
jgi:hypothetical protein